MLSGQFYLYLLFKTLFSFIKNAGGKKKPAKSNKGLLPTPFKGVFSGKVVVLMVEYDGKIQELIVPSQSP